MCLLCTYAMCTGTSLAMTRRRKRLQGGHATDQRRHASPAGRRVPEYIKKAGIQPARQVFDNSGRWSVASSPTRARAASPVQQPRGTSEQMALPAYGDSCLNTLLELLHMPIEAVSESIASAELRKQLVNALDSDLSVKAQRIIGVVAARLRRSGAAEDADVLLAQCESVLAAQQIDDAATNPPSSGERTSLGSVAANYAAGTPPSGWTQPAAASLAETADQRTVDASRARAFYRQQLARASNDATCAPFTVSVATLEWRRHACNILSAMCCCVACFACACAQCDFQARPGHSTGAAT
eukprot:COSAG01_NODE_4535_length_4945_cov_4.370409_5_plen_298_part_00